MFAVIYIPDFFLQAVLRHEPELWDAPAALVREDTARSPLWEVTPAARRRGVYPGMTSTQAKARCEGMVFRLRSIPQEESAEEVLLECAYVSAAYLEATGRGLCTADLRGLPLLKANPLAPALEAWAVELRSRLSRFHLHAQIGIAEAPELALQAAQGESPFCFVADAQQFRATLRVEALNPALETASVLQKWGIRTAGELLALGKARVAERLGAAGLELYERAMTDRIRPLRLTTPQARYAEMFTFEQVVETLEPLLFVVRRLLDQLVRRIEMLGRSVSEMHLDLHLESEEHHRASLKVPSPTREAPVLFRIMHNYLENVRTASPILAVAIEAATSATEVRQFQLFESTVRDANRFSETTARLNALLGEGRVGTPFLRDSHKPDDFEMRLPEPMQALRPRLDLEDRKVARRGLALRRYRPPLPASVRLKEGEPIFLSTSGPSGTIVGVRGPWRLSGNWWEQLWARDEWDIQLKDGGLYRIALEKGEWFLDGAYD